MPKNCCSCFSFWRRGRAQVAVAPAAIAPSVVASPVVVVEPVAPAPVVEHQAETRVAAVGALAVPAPALAPLGSVVGGTLAAPDADELRAWEEAMSVESMVESRSASVDTSGGSDDPAAPILGLTAEQERTIARLDVLVERVLAPFVPRSVLAMDARSLAQQRVFTGEPKQEAEFFSYTNMQHLMLRETLYGVTYSASFNNDKADFIHFTCKAKERLLAGSRSNGWKLHIAIDDSQNDGNLERAWGVVLPILMQYELTGFKVIAEPLRKIFAHHPLQCGKQITIYAFKNPEINSALWGKIITTITQRLAEANIRPGPAPSYTDWSVNGSNYFHFRTDNADANLSREQPRDVRFLFDPSDPCLFDDLKIEVANQPERVAYQELPAELLQGPRDVDAAAAAAEPPMAQGAPQ